MVERGACNQEKKVLIPKAMREMLGLHDASYDLCYILIVENVGKDSTARCSDGHLHSDAHSAEQKCLHGNSLNCMCFMEAGDVH